MASVAVSSKAASKVLLYNPLFVVAHIVCTILLLSLFCDAVMCVLSCV